MKIKKAAIAAIVLVLLCGATAFAQNKTALTIQCDVVGAQVYINERLAGSTTPNFSLLVPAGKLQIRVQKSGYKTFETIVTAVGNPIIIDAKLAAPAVQPAPVPVAPAPVVPAPTPIAPAPVLPAPTPIAPAPVVPVPAPVVPTVAAIQIIKDAVLTWSTSAGQNGTMKISLVDGAYFEADQTNEQNRAAGVIKLYGALVEDGRRLVLINIGQWKGVWDGLVSRDSINGTIAEGSGRYTFTITAAAPAVSTAPFVVGRTLRWETNAAGGQRGTLYVSAAQGSTFNVEQKNNNNPGAGITKMDGEVKGGQIYIYNRQWGETWVGSLSGGTVAGTINNAYTFKIYE